MKKQAIIQAALTEFSQKTYENASVNTIIEDSKTSKGTFYHYFKSKKELYTYLLDLMVKTKIAFFQQAQGNISLPDTVSLFDLLRSQVDLSIDFVISYPQYASFALQVHKETDAALRSTILKHLGALSTEYYTQIIKENIAQGHVRNDMPIEFVTGFIVYVLAHMNDILKMMECELTVENRDSIKVKYCHLISILEKGLSSFT
jgi:AcrR family transcriptional regulator